MKHKKIQWITNLSFLGFIYLFSIWNILTPQKAFSEHENRNLAQFPKHTLANLFSGTFDDAFEVWFSDQFLHRNQWIMLKSYTKKITGAIENNDVYYGKDGSLIRQFQTFKPEQLSNNIQSIQKFTTTNHVKANLLFVPSATQIRKNVLPYGAYDIDQQELLKKIEQEFTEQNFIHLYDLFNYNDNDYYFHTDHHWNHLGAYVGYKAIATQILKKEPEIFTTTAVNHHFYGTMYSKSGAFWSKADDIYKMVPIKDIEVLVTYDDGHTDTTLFSEKRLNEKDKYMYYVDGNHAHVNIKTSNHNKKKALIVKDSYAHILLPYLYCEYEEIDLIDLRYYHTKLSDQLTENTDLYFIYSLDNFTQDTNLVFLR